MQLPLITTNQELYLYSEAICRMDIQTLYHLSENLDSKNRENMLSRLKGLNIMFNKFKHYGNQYLISHRGICNSCFCNPGRIGFLYIGNCSDYYTAIVFEMEKDKVIDFSNCSNFLRGQFPELGYTYKDINGLKPNTSNYNYKKDFDIEETFDLISREEIEKDALEERIEKGQKIDFIDYMNSNISHSNEENAPIFIYDKLIIASLNEIKAFKGKVVPHDFIEKWCNRYNKAYHYINDLSNKNYLKPFDKFFLLENVKHWNEVFKFCNTYYPIIHQSTLNEHIDLIKMIDLIETSDLQLSQLSFYYKFFDNELSPIHPVKPNHALYSLDDQLDIYIELPSYEFCKNTITFLKYYLDFIFEPYIEFKKNIIEETHDYKKYLLTGNTDIESNIKTMKNLTKNNVYYKIDQDILFQSNTLSTSEFNFKTPVSMVQNQNIEILLNCKVAIDFFIEKHHFNDPIEHIIIFDEYFEKNKDVFYIENEKEDDSEMDSKTNQLLLLNDYVNTYLLLYQKVKHQKHIPHYAVFCEIYEKTKAALGVIINLPKNLDSLLKFQDTLKDENRLINFLLIKEPHVFSYLDFYERINKQHYLSIDYITIDKKIKINLGMNRARQESIILFFEHYLKGMDIMNVKPPFLEGIKSYNPHLHGKYLLSELLNDKFNNQISNDKQFP